MPWPPQCGAVQQKARTNSVLLPGNWVPAFFSRPPCAVNVTETSRQRAWIRPGLLQGSGFHSPANGAHMWSRPAVPEPPGNRSPQQEPTTTQQLRASCVPAPFTAATHRTQQLLSALVWKHRRTEGGIASSVCLAVRGDDDRAPATRRPRPRLWARQGGRKATGMHVLVTLEVCGDSWRDSPTSCFCVGTNEMRLSPRPPDSQRLVGATACSSNCHLPDTQTRCTQYRVTGVVVRTTARLSLGGIPIQTG